MIATLLAIWFGAASMVAHELRFPPWYHPPGSAHRLPALPGGSAQPADPRAECGADYESITVNRTDGFRLRGWFVPASRREAVILLHGAGADRRVMLPFLGFLHSAGYPVLLVDSIDSGESDDLGRGVGFGWRERLDVIAAAAMLRARGFTRVGALGASQGAAAAILAQAEEHILGAIVSDSSYPDLAALLRRMPSIEDLNPFFVRTVMWELGLALGHPPAEIAPMQAAARLGNCALMVIGGEKDPLIPVASAQAIYAAASGPKELWLVPGASHTDAINVAPAEYARRVTEFLGKYLASSSGP